MGDRDSKDLLKRVAPAVVRPGIGSCIVESVGLGPSHVISGKLQPLDMHGILLRPFPDSLSRSLAPVCKQITNPFTKGHQLQNLVHRLMVAEVKLQPPRILLAQDPLLIEFHGKGDRHP